MTPALATYLLGAGMTGSVFVAACYRWLLRDPDTGRLDRVHPLHVIVGLVVMLLWPGTLFAVAWGIASDARMTYGPHDEDEEAQA
jgi:hypothetical protein